MATCLFHVTGPTQAYRIAASGRYAPLSVNPMNTDACFNLFATSVRGEPITHAPDRQLMEGTGAALVVEWSGPEEIMRTWSETPPQRNVLYHQPWDAHKSEDPLAKPEAYYRSLVLAGTEQHLSIVGFRLDEDRVKEAWIFGVLPSEVMGAWRLAPEVVRRAVAGYGVQRMHAAMQRVVGTGGRPLVVEGWWSREGSGKTTPAAAEAMN